MDEEAIFLDALQITSPEARAAHLDKVCNGNPDLRSDVELLIKSHENRGAFLEVALGAARSDELPPDAWRGMVIGPFTLLEQIGEGGMGLVFVAEQRHPMCRKVALKLIKPGMDSREVIARFEAERQMLALMDHPHIAQVYDAGTTTSGQPYFVMELVKGAPITQYCDANRLGTRQRLELFIDVCQALEHAHQKGIIHRDVKPTNVLVSSHDGRPTVKVIDFGVAKAIGQGITERTLFTTGTQMVGTPMYVSPEQATGSGQNIDTRADIYSLGVLLYELLSGTTPFDRTRLKDAAFDEIRRIIREEEPVKPSTRISASQGAAVIAAHRGSDPSQLARLVRGDLDWIVMKALDKDRARRYATATGFAADIARYLTDQPVEACPPTVTYRCRKFARRNRLAISTASLVTGALVVGLVASTWQAARATRAQREADENAAQVRQSMDRLVRSYRLMETGDLHVRSKRWPQAFADYDEAVRLRSDNPLVWLRRGNLYVDLYLWDLAAPDLAKSFELHTTSEASIWSDHAFLRLYMGDTEGYDRICQQMPEHFRGAGTRNSWWVARTCTMAPTTSVDPQQILLEATIAFNSDPKSLPYLFVLGSAHYRAGQFQQAIDRLKEATVGDSEWTNSEIWPMLAMASYGAGKIDEAQHMLDKTQRGFEETLREISTRAIHPDMVPRNKLDLLSLYLLHREAQALIRPSARIEHTLLWVQHGFAHKTLGNSREALAYFSRAIAERPDLGEPWLARGLSYAVEAQWDKAADDCAKAAELTPTNPAVVFNAAAVLWLADRKDEYRKLCVDAFGRGGPVFDAGNAYFLAGAAALVPNNPIEPVRLEELAEQAVTHWPGCAWCLQTAGTTHYRAGNFDVARARMNESLQIDPSWRGKHITWLVLAMIEVQTGHPREAQQWFKQAEDGMGRDSPHFDKTAAGILMQANEWLTYRILHREAAALLAVNTQTFND